ncbi:MAG: RsiV family protein [Clostridia bacterium]|nr:RsiV family protein [Clostridia bacterium]
MRGKRLILASIGLTAAMLTTTVFAAGSLHVIRMTENSAAQGVKYGCAYPRLAGIQNDARQQRLNIRFREMAQTARLSAELEAKMAPGAAVEGGYNFKITRNRGGILSVKLTDTRMRTGGVQTKSGGVTINTVSGATYRLGDLFFDNADYVTMMNQKIKEQISQRGPDRTQFKDFKGIRSNQGYYLTEDSLVLILKSDYSPENLAGQEFTIQLKSLEGSLKPSLRLST